MMAAACVRSDRLPVNPQLTQQHGITCMPRFIRRDDACGRYTFRNGVPEGQAGSYNGTRNCANSEAGKYLDCLNKYIVAFDGTQNNAMQREVALAKEQKGMLDAAGVVVVAGAANAAYEDVALEARDLGVRCIARVKAGTVTLFDAEHERLLSGHNWEVNGTTPRIRGSDSVRLPLAEYVWKVCAGRSVGEGQVVVPINWEHFDVRLDNLMVVEGASGKSCKRPTTVSVPAEAVEGLGMRFLPRGVQLSKDRGGHVVQVKRADGSVSKIGVGARKTMLVALQDAVGKLKSDDAGFDGANRVFQQRMAEFEALMRVALEA